MKDRIKAALPAIIIFCIIGVCLWGVWRIISNPQAIVQSETTSDSVDVHIMGNDYKVPVSGSADAQGLYMLTDEQPIDVSVSSFSGIHVYINGEQFQSGESKKIRIKSIASGESITVKITDKYGTVKGTTEFATMPAEFGQLRFLKTEKSDRTYCFSYGNYVYKTDADGNLLYYRNAGVKTSDFRQDSMGGKTYYSYFVTTGKSDGSVARVVMDSTYKSVDWVENLVPDTIVSRNSPLSAGGFEILGDKHYLVTGYVGKLADNIPSAVPHSAFGTSVSAAVIQEIKDGKVVFEWDSTSCPELYPMAYGASGYRKSGTLVNYAQLDGLLTDPKDGNPILSFSSMDAIVKIDKKTGKLLWVLGGSADQFGLSNAQKFGRQLSVTRTQDGSLIILENRSAPAAKGSSATKSACILEASVDEQLHKITAWKEYPVDFLNLTQGTASRIGEGQFIVTCGNDYKNSPILTQLRFDTGKIMLEIIADPNS